MTKINYKSFVYNFKNSLKNPHNFLINYKSTISKIINIQLLTLAVSEYKFVEKRRDGQFDKRESPAGRSVPTYGAYSMLTIKSNGYIILMINYNHLLISGDKEILGII